MTWGPTEERFLKKFIRDGLDSDDLWHLIFTDDKQSNDTAIHNIKLSFRAFVKKEQATL